MEIKGVRFYGDDFTFHYGNVKVTNGYFSGLEILDSQPPRDTLLLLPGLVDIHLHGANGVDFSDCDYSDFLKAAQFLASNGVTSFHLATMSLPEHALTKVCQTAKRFQTETPDSAAVICGITMEGPFFNSEKKGAQSAAHLRKPDLAMFHRLQKSSGGLIRIACVAPELDGALEYIQDASQENITVSLAHTNADYDTASAGFYAGATHVTHLFNAMPPLLHRSPGIIGAAAERDTVTAELICGGLHLHPSIVRAAFKLFGADRLCLISDAMAATGMGDGMFFLGGQTVFVRNRCARLENGSLAGSASTLLDCVKNAVAMGIDLPTALRCATANPARVIGAIDIGSIAIGKRADFLICTEELSLQSVYLSGRKLNTVT